MHSSKELLASSGGEATFAVKCLPIHRTTKTYLTEMVIVLRLRNPDADPTEMRRNIHPKWLRQEDLMNTEHVATGF